MYNSNIEQFAEFFLYQCATKCRASKENDKLACTISCINCIVCPLYGDKGENVNKTGCDFGKNISNQYEKIK